VGTPGSGKSWSIVNPIIRQLMAKEYCLCVFDFKYPDLGKILYYHFLLAKQKGKCKNYTFHVINPTEPEKSRRINLFRKDWLKTLADASETAEALVEAMKKGLVAVISSLPRVRSISWLPVSSFSASTRMVSILPFRMCFPF
jgi:hypothetical protein